MKDFKIILSEFNKVDLKKNKAAIATVVRVRGSSYRSPGARMLITDDGKWVGSISGCCLEGDALRKARQVMADKQPITITYDTREESNQNLGIGLGCNGIIHVLIEPLDDKDNRNTINLFEGFISTKEPLALATIFNATTGVAEKLLITGNDEMSVGFNNSHIEEVVRRDLLELFESKKSEARRYKSGEDEVEVFIELIQPTISVILFGGGFDARPVSELAKNLGWD